MPKSLWISSWAVLNIFRFTSCVWIILGKDLMEVSQSANVQAVVVKQDNNTC